MVSSVGPRCVRGDPGVGMDSGALLSRGKSGGGCLSQGRGTV